MNAYNIIKNHVQEWDNYDELVECLNNFYYEYDNGKSSIELNDKGQAIYKNPEDKAKLTKSQVFHKVVLAIDYLSNKLNKKQAYEYFNIYEPKKYNYED